MASISEAMTSTARSAQRSRLGALLAAVQRYAGASIGPVGVAGAQFLLSLLLLKSVSPAGFGAYSIVMVLFFLALGLWGALFCAPLPVLLAESRGEKRRALVRSLFSANLIAALFVSCGFAAICWFMLQDVTAAAFCGGFAGSMMLRWFARGFAYATRAERRTVMSDVVYTGVLLSGVATLFLADVASVRGAFGALCLAAVLALGPFGWGYFKRQFIGFSPSAVLAYRDIWRSRSGWSVVGVLSIEATSNAHAYAVSGLLGAAAYAPVAACALLVRPILLVCNALTEFERPRIGRDIGVGRIDRATGALKPFLSTLFFVWVGNVGASAALLCWIPGLLFSEAYAFPTIVAGTALFLLLTLVKVVCAPRSVLLQAAGEFRALAVASLASSMVSLVSVALLLFIVPPVYTLLGVVLGESVYAVLIWRVARRWTSQQLALQGGSQVEATGERDSNQVASQKLVE